MSPLNPNAPDFCMPAPTVSVAAGIASRVSRHSRKSSAKRNRTTGVRGARSTMMEISDEEQQCMYEWICLLVDLEALEADHLIEMALRHAPAEKVREIQDKYTQDVPHASPVTAC